MVTTTSFSTASEQNPPVKKGTIMCDASALRLLMITFPAEKIIGENVRRTPLHSLFGALVFLAKNGYEVIIPEMVAHEMGGFMRDGNSYHLEYMDSGDEEFHKRMTYRSFFREVVRLEAQGVPIHIQPPLQGNHSAEARHVNAIYDIHCAHVRTHAKAEQLEALHWRGVGRQQDAGDKEIISYVEATDDGKTPIFILSNDGTLQHSFPKQRHIFALGAAGFMNALNKHYLLPSCGLQPVSVEAYKALLAHRNAGLTPDRIAQEAQVFSGARSRADTYSGYPFHLVASPFDNAMKNLAAALGIVAPVIEEVETPTSRINQPHPQGIVLPHFDFSRATVRRA